jgi:hypothetical protein
MLDLLTCTILPVKSLGHAKNARYAVPAEYWTLFQVPRDRGLCASLNLLDTIGIARYSGQVGLLSCRRPLESYRSTPVVQRSSPPILKLSIVVAFMSQGKQETDIGLRKQTTQVWPYLQH